MHELDATGDENEVFQKVLACLTDPPVEDIESSVEPSVEPWVTVEQSVEPWETVSNIVVLRAEPSGDSNGAVIEIESDSASDVALSVGPSVEPVVSNVSSQLRMPNGAVIEIVALAAEASAAALEAAVATSLSLSLSLPHSRSPSADLSDQHAC